MSKNIDISVIIPVYNGETHIADAIDSVLMQGVSLEIIAVDDASCDSTPAILHKYEKSLPDFRVISFSKNRGVGAARSAALNLARGKYLAFCDSDDTVPHGAYRALLRAARERDVVVGAYMNVGEDGIVSGRFKPPHKRERTLFKALFSVCCLWNKLFRREFIEKRGLDFDTGMTIGEDVVFLGHLYNLSPTYSTTDRPVYAHRLRSGSLIHTYTLSSFLKHIECRRILLGLCKCPEAEKYVSVELSPFLRNFLFNMSPSDLSAAFDAYRDFFLELSHLMSDEVFEVVIGLKRDDFLRVNAREYLGILSMASPRDRVLTEYRSGAIGLLWIIKFFAAWLKYKFSKILR